MTLITEQKKTFKYQAVYSALAAEARRLSVGKKVKSVRSLMNQYQASRATVDRALLALRTEGWLESQPGKGIYVTRPRKEENGLPGQIDMLFFGIPDLPRRVGFYREMLDEISHLLGRRNVGVRANTLPPDSKPGDVEEYIGRLKPQAVIVVNLYNPDIVETFRSKNIPYVLLFPSCPQPLPRSINVDNAQIAKLWLEHLTQKGHRNIAMLHTVPRDWFFRDGSERLRFYYEESGRHGMVVDPDLTHFAGFNPDSGYEATQKLLRSGKTFTAIIVPDIVAAGVYKAITEEGTQVGRDISVIGVDNLEIGEHLHPTLTSVNLSRRKMAEMGIGTLSEVFRNTENDDSLFLPVELIQRQSVQPVNSESLE